MLILSESGIALSRLNKPLYDDMVNVLSLAAEGKLSGFKASDLSVNLGLKMSTYKHITSFLDRLKSYGILDYKIDGKKYVISIIPITKYYTYLGFSNYTINPDKSLFSYIYERFKEDFSAFDGDLSQSSVILTRFPEDSSGIFSDFSIKNFADFIYIYIKKLKEKDLQPTIGGVARDKQVVANFGVSSENEKPKKKRSKKASILLSSQDLYSKIEPAILENANDLVKRYCSAPSSTGRMEVTELLTFLSALPHDQQIEAVNRIESKIASTQKYRPAFKTLLKDGFFNALDIKTQSVSGFGYNHRYSVEDFQTLPSLKRVDPNNPYSNYSRQYGISDKYDLEERDRDHVYLLGKLLETCGAENKANYDAVMRYAQIVADAKRNGEKSVNTEIMVKLHKFLQVPLPEALQKSTQSGQISLLSDSN